jgi:hypothetical protein
MPQHPASCRAFQRGELQGVEQMNKSILNFVAAGTLAVVLAGCNRAESPQEVSQDVAEAQADRSENVQDARVDQAQVAANTSADAVSANPDDRGAAIEDRAEAAYNTKLAAAKGDHDVAKQGCEALKGDAQESCKKSAEATYEAAKASAQMALNAERERSDATKKLDN